MDEQLKRYEILLSDLQELFYKLESACWFGDDTSDIKEEFESKLEELKMSIRQKTERYNAVR